jgi:hypothetical protein
MAATSDKNSSSTESGNAATATQISQGIATTLSSSDASVRQGLQTLGMVHQARLSLATRTVSALKVQYGSDDSRVQAAEAHQTAISTTVARVAVVRARTAAPAVQVAATGWALQGHVLDAKLQPAAKSTVFLVDATKNYLRRFGFSYTDDTGAFLISYQGDPAGAQASAEEMFVAVADPQANPVYLASAAFTPAAGSTTYQDIVLPADGKPIGDPPPALRADAFPGEGEAAETPSS